MKRFLCLALAVLSICSMSISAFAAQPATPAPPQASDALNEQVLIEPDRYEVSITRAANDCLWPNKHNWVYDHTLFVDVGKNGQIVIETYYVYICTKCGATLKEKI